MKVGLVGFAGSGKTTVFNALTGLSAEVGGYGKSAKANMGVIQVPDLRVEKLSQIFNSKKKTLARIEFVDVAGPESKEASGLDQKLINAIREVDALVLVLRAFENHALPVGPDPVRDLELFEAELAISDLLQVEHRLERVVKEKALEREKDLFTRAKTHLETGKPLRTFAHRPDEAPTLANFRFLSQKHLLSLVNLPEDHIAQGTSQGLKAAAQARGLQYIEMSAHAEMEISQLDAEHQAEFLAHLGLKEPARDRFIRAAYGLLDLISFLTMGEDESRAWTIKRGMSAQKAGGRIHTDIERGFIRAEVISYEDFISLGSEAKCREAGRLRLEGKEYIVQDGDIMSFRFNV
ncbi:redox-regulated ATPase YchF [Candidatus Acetothermia bacterium]|nr:redox-regulated ATPase YchF [Candidatus Acetothermia bacterium]MBI3661351.1 redox-regulated ATPase YchF [Candidatus Acetothermia bacterium]